MWGLLRALLNNIPAVIVIFVAVIVLGGVALVRLPVDLFPDIEVPVVAVRIEYRGASPEDVEKNVARIVEGQFLTISGVKNVVTRCFEESVFFLVEFNYGVNIDLVANDIREKLDLVSGILPEEVGRPQILKFDPSNLPIMNIAITGLEDLSALRELADNNIARKIYQVDGVANVSVEGGYSKKVFVELDPKRMNSFAISPSDVVRSLASENQSYPAGYVMDGYRKVNLRFSSEFRDTMDIEKVIVGVRGRYAVKVEDIADVSFSEDRENAPIVKVNGRNGVILSVSKKSGSSTVFVSEGVKRKIEELRTLYPNLEFIVISDQGSFIVESLNNVRNNALNGAILAVLVVLLFLAKLKETILIGIAIPFSLILSFVFMYFLDISLNVVSLAGLALGVGMMVDNSIVVLESIYLRLRQGKSLFDSAFEGTKEVGLAILASTLTTVVVFAPVIFSQGLASQIFRDLSLTISISIFSSLFVALFIVPPLASRHWGLIEKWDKGIQSSHFLVLFSNWVERVRDGVYERLLTGVLDLKKTVLVFTIVFVILGVLSFLFVGKELLPVIDSGDIDLRVTLPPGTHKEVTAKYGKRIEEFLLRDENVKYFYYTIGSGGIARFVGRGGDNRINVVIKLKEKEKRKMTSEEFAVRLRKFLSYIPGRYNVITSGSIRLPGGGGANVDIKLFGDDIDKLEQLAKRIQEVGSKVNGVQEINTTFDEQLQEYALLFDRTKLGFYGISSAILGNIIKTSFYPSTVSFFRKDGKQYDVVVQLKEEERKHLEDVLLKYVPTATGIVPLVDLIEVSNTTSPRVIVRENNNRQVSLNIVGFGVAQDKLVQGLADAIRREVYIPPEVIIDYGGSFKELQNTFRDLLLVFALAFTLVYTVMVILFKSFKSPFIILFTIPYGTFAVLIVFFMLGMKINIISGIGLVLLLGIVVNNGIVMVDYMDQLLARGFRLREAVVEGAKRRFRPVLMTALTTIIGVLPLALGIGASSELFQPLGLVVLIGLTLGTFFTLFIIPVMFEYFNRKRFA
ncbi:MAG: efflux RND transporter permease subunit [Brevinematia bacterium]